MNPMRCVMLATKCFADEHERQTMTTGARDIKAAREIARVDELRLQPAETVAALVNAARLADRHASDMPWGIADGSHAVEGAT